MKLAVVYFTLCQTCRNMIDKKTEEGLPIRLCDLCIEDRRKIFTLSRKKIDNQNRKTYNQNKG